MMSRFPSPKKKAAVFAVLTAIGAVGALGSPGCGSSNDDRYYCDNAGCYQCDAYGCSSVEPPAKQACTGASSWPSSRRVKSSAPW